MHAFMNWLAGQHGYALFLLRIVTGFFLLMAGVLRIPDSFEGMAGFYATAGIPLPHILAPAISIWEIIGGAALILGLFTRHIAVVFAIQFIVASWAAATVTGTIFGAARVPELILFISILLATQGGGALSLGQALGKKAS